MSSPWVFGWKRVKVQNDAGDRALIANSIKHSICLLETGKRVVYIQDCGRHINM